MRKTLLIIAAALYLAVPADAQQASPQASGATWNLAAIRSISLSESAFASRPEAPLPSQQRYPSPDEYKWQVSMSYTYSHLRFPGNGRNMSGFSTSIIRYVNDWFGLEGNATSTFSNLPGNARAKYFFYGGGIHIAWRNSTRLDPWGHFLAGGARVLPQTALGGTSTLAYVGGAGVDLKMTGRLYFRISGDYFGTRLFSRSQNNYQASGGIVINF